MLQRLYARILALAATPAAPFWLAAIAVAEGSFFPVPPDLLLIPMVLARRDRAWMLAAICTVASLCGGTIGWLLGAELLQLAMRLIHLYHGEHALALYQARFAQYGFAVILLKGLTPIPYKLVTITSGFANYNIWMFIGLSIIARGLRFFIVAVLLNRYGVWIRETIEKRLGLWVGIGVGVLLLGFIIAFRMF